MQHGTVVSSCVVGLVVTGIACWQLSAQAESPPVSQPGTAKVTKKPAESTDPGLLPVAKSNAEWKKRLTPEQYRVTREKGTERAYSGKLWDNHEQGLYRCVCCGQPLFSSEAKFESGTGWPSFYQPIRKESVSEHADYKLLVPRTEIVCSRCDAHLGHVFKDGPKPTGLRYCMNSAALKFEKKADAEKK